jgi:hypothetical protein
VSLLVELLVVAGGLAVGRWLAQRLRPAAKADAEKAGRDAVPEMPGLDAFPCRLGDVVVRKLERDEAWIAGALILEEQRPVAALFIGPEVGSDRVIWAHEADQGLTWLSSLRPDELLLPGEPPLAIEHAGVRFERRRRLPVRVRKLGDHVPPVGDSAVVAEYIGPGADRIVVLIGAEQTWLWRGTVLRRSDFDVLPGGQDDAREHKAR